MGYTVFISYAHVNSAERSALVAALSGLPEVNVLYDKKDMQINEEIEGFARRCVAASDCVVVLLTSEGLPIERGSGRNRYGSIEAGQDDSVNSIPGHPEGRVAEFGPQQTPH